MGSATHLKEGGCVALGRPLHEDSRKGQSCTQGVQQQNRQRHLNHDATDSGRRLNQTHSTTATWCIRGQGYAEASGRRAASSHTVVA